MFSWFQCYFWIRVSVSRTKWRTSAYLKILIKESVLLHFLIQPSTKSLSSTIMSRSGPAQSNRIVVEIRHTCLLYPMIFQCSHSANCTYEPVVDMTVTSPRNAKFRTIRSYRGIIVTPIHGAFLNYGYSLRSNRCNNWRLSRDTAFGETPTPAARHTIFWNLPFSCNGFLHKIFVAKSEARLLVYVSHASTIWISRRPR